MTKRIYKFEVTITEDDFNTPYWDGVKAFETSDNRWVLSDVKRLLNSGEFYNVKVNEISPVIPIDKGDNL